MKNQIAIGISLALLVAGPLATPYQPAVHAESGVQPLATASSDRNADLVIGVPYEAIGGDAAAGAAHVLYGTSATGLTAGGSQLWYQGNSGLQGAAEANDEFGFALAAGDFNGDAYPDLAIGVHGEDIGNPVIADAGVVQVLYGTASGLGATNNQLWHQDVAGVQDAAEVDDRFGYKLAAGDFDGDGFADLAIGILREDVGAPAVNNAGMVQIFYGAAGGLSARGNQLFYQGAGGVQETAEADDGFGSSLTAGDFDGDGYADLAVGAPLEDIGANIDAGAVQILFGTAGGLSAVRDQLWHQDVNGVEDAAEGGDRFGHALVSGDANGDGYADLAVGVPYEDVSSPVVVDAGAVQLLFGAAGIGLTATGNWLIEQDYFGVVGQASANDRFGSSLAGGDFDGNGRSDLAVGVPRKDAESPTVGDAGAVHILYSGTGGSNELWFQGHDALGDTAELDDRFGSSLAAGDFDDDGFADLAVGVPLEDREGVDPAADAGIVQILNGSAGGLTAGGSQLWNQDSAGIDGAVEANDRFGTVLLAISPAKVKLFLPHAAR
jgi:hypothetical protein